MTDSATLERPAHETASNQDLPATEAYREVRFRHSKHFLPVLQQLRSSLLVSTYSAGKLAAVGVSEEKLTLSFHNVEQAMGVAVHPGGLAVGAKGQVWFFKEGGELAARIEPAGRYDACYMARSALITGHIHVHEMAWADKIETGDRQPAVVVSSASSAASASSELWVVNTLFSCLCTLSDEFSFVPRWRPPFITALQGQDRCHLNEIFAVEVLPGVRCASLTGPFPHQDGGEDVWVVPPSEAVGRPRA